jgi:hypothetical protein
MPPGTEQTETVRLRRSAGVFPSWLKGWIDRETMQRLRAIRNPIEKKIELTRTLGFPERVFTDFWDLIPKS